ncbi:glycosyltransferase family 4 protein [Rhodocyclaceae bacterium SMB388]
MKVLHVTNAFPNMEAPVRGVFIEEQINSLREAGVSCTVFVIPSQKDGIKAYASSIPHIQRLSRDYDVVHAHHVLSGFASVLAGVGSKLVVSYMNDYGRNVLKVGRWTSLAIERFVYWNCKRAIFKTQPPFALSDEKDLLAPNGVDFDSFRLLDKHQARHLQGVPDDAFALLFVSANNLHRPAKRYDLFVQILNELKLRGLNVYELTMVDRTRKETLELFNAADALLVTSDFEGSPNAVKEALASGLRVVSRDVGDISNLLEDVPFCKIVSPFTVTSFSDAVCSVLSTQDARNPIRDAFRLKSYDQKLIAERIITMYRTIVESDDNR